MSLPNDPIQAGLTQRESEILRLIAKGHSNNEIAVMLHIATGTVEWHVHQILEKLGAANRTQAVIKAIQMGYIEPEDIE